MINKPTAQLMKRMQIAMASYKQHFGAHIKKYEKDTGEKISIPIEQLREYILKGNYDVKVGNPDYSLSFMFSSAQEVAPIFHGMKWAFLETTDDEYFLTSDNPLYYMDTTYKPGSFCGVGLMNKKLEVTFPLSRKLALFATWDGLTGYHQANSSIRKTINWRTIVSAQNFVFAPEKSLELSELVKKYKNSSPKIKVS